MSDFDQFYKDRLDEEQEFPNRERNWGHMSKRLDAFSLGSAGSPGIHHLYWKAAAAVFLAAAGGLFWKMNSVQNELTALREEIKAANSIHATPPAVAVIPQGTTTLPAAPETGLPSTLHRLPSTVHRLPSTDHKLPIELNHTLVPSSNATAANKSNPLKPQVPASNSELPAKSSPDAPTADPLIRPVSGQEINPPAESGAGDAANVSGSSARMVSLLSNLESTIYNPRSQARPPHEFIPNAVVSIPPPAMIIRPVKDKSHFRAGVHVLGGTPTTSQKTISTIVGQGIDAEFTPLRNLGVFGSVDFTHFDINSQKYRPELPFDEPKNDPQHFQHDLAAIEGSQRQQNISLGIRYSVPLNFWVRPAVRIAHTWTHFNSCVVSSRFEEMHGPGGPGPGHDDEYIIIHTPPKNFSNIWRFGAGLEHEAPRWVFSVWCDYVKNGNTSNAGFSNLFVQAGAAYKFR